METRITTPEIALVGNPNAGKTTIFNSLTGNAQRVGNWPGVTVERSEGTIQYRGKSIRIIDLPGMYSLSAGSEDEQIARDYILSRSAQVIVNVVDATNLERNLYLTSQLLELDRPIIVVITMADRAEREGITIDVPHLAVHLGVPVLMVNSLQSPDISHLRDELALHVQGTAISCTAIRYPEPIEQLIQSWEERFDLVSKNHDVSPRWVAVKFIEGDSEVEQWVFGSKSMPVEQWKQTSRLLQEQLGDEPDVVVADSRFGFVHGITRDVVRRRLNRESVTEKIDRVVMNSFLGIPIFLALMFVVFWFTIAVGGAFVDFFDITFGALLVDGSAVLLRSLHAPDWIILILSDGLGAGLQTVATFVPIIFMMFFMLSVMEHSGYMARAAFVMDRFMRSLGLSGKSFVPLLVGFGCTVPAIAATRTLESRKERMMTAFMAPLMSCGARLPVYALFSAAFFPDSAGFVVFSLYFLGILLAIVTGLLLKRFVFPGEGTHLVMELPPYHLPGFGSTVRYSWNRLRLFVVGAGTTIMIAVTILSLLNTITIPSPDGAMEESVLQRVGKAITPVFAPMGIEKRNWPAAVGLFTGLFAKEAIVGTLNSLYEITDSDADFPTEEISSYPRYLLQRFADAGATVVEAVANIGVGVSSDGGVPAGARVDRLRLYFSPAAAYAYLVFVLLYIPCLAAMGAAIAELGLFHGSILALYLTGTAWAVSTLAYQLISGPQLLPVVLSLLLAGAMVSLFLLMGYRERRTVRDRR